MSPASRERLRGSRLWTAMLGPAGILLLCLFVIPLALVVVFSFGTTDIIGRPVLGLTLANFQEVAQSYNLPTVGRTVLFAAATTIICLVVGYSVAYTAARFAGRFGPVLVAAFVAPWLVDYLVRIYAWKSILDRSGLLNGLLATVHLGSLTLLGTPWAVIAGLVYGYLPLMILPIYASLGQLDPAVIDAGKDLFGTPSRTFLHVTLPATREGLTGGCPLVFLPALGDFATTQFLGGPNTTMIGSTISDQFLSAGSQTFGAAMTVTLLAALALTVALAAVLARRRRSVGGGVDRLGDTVEELGGAVGFAG